jgi:hypothetical protein
MKRYLCFWGLAHYPPHRGWESFKGSFDTPEEAEKFLINYKEGIKGWWQIVDSITEKILIESNI